MTHTPKLTPEQFEAFGRELDAIKEKVVADLGQADVDYIRRIVKAQRGMEVAGRAMLMFPLTWLPGTALLSVSKILDNMEIGHNVMHGQYEWTGDPALSGQTFEWDTACPTSGATRTTSPTTRSPTSSAWIATSATASCG
jgi:fatty acid desaturase